MTEMEDFGIFVLLIFWFDDREKELFISCDCFFCVRGELFRILEFVNGMRTIFCTEMS